MKTVLSPDAIEDLREAFEFIAKDNLSAAHRFLGRVLDTLDLLASGIIRGRKVSLSGKRACRAWSISPYWIYHVVTESELRILRVYHQARRPLEGRR